MKGGRQGSNPHPHNPSPSPNPQNNHQNKEGPSPRAPEVADIPPPVALTGGGARAVLEEGVGGGGLGPKRWCTNNGPISCSRWQIRCFPRWSLCSDVLEERRGGEGLAVPPPLLLWPPPLFLCPPPLLLWSPPDPGAKGAGKFYFKDKSSCAKGTEEIFASNSGSGGGF